MTIVNNFLMSIINFISVILNSLAVTVGGIVGAVAGIVVGVITTAAQLLVCILPWVIVIGLVSVFFKLLGV